MVSIITPFYNVESYLKDSIQSVINQTYQNWELILINDGSSDSSKGISLSFKDPRIRYFEQENKGVSAARNVGLVNMNGEFFCFLDADDVLPLNSLKSRLNLLLRNPFLDFVDGQVDIFDSELKKSICLWKPTFQGENLKDLVRLTGKSFVGQTWMVRRKCGKNYRFHENLTHGEDLLFFMKLAKEGGQYAYVNEPILQYRSTIGSAMSNLESLEKGYRFIENEIKNWPELNSKDLKIFSYRYRRSMFLSYLRVLKLKNALQVIIK